MRRLLPLLLLLALLAVLPSTALPEPNGSWQEAAREDALRHNRRLLEKWRADPEHYQRLQRDLKAFWELPTLRQNMIGICVFLSTHSTRRLAAA